MGKKSKPPPAPDYAGIAAAQAAEQTKQIDKQNSANRPTQITPWGSTSWTNEGGDNWTEHVTLNQAEQEQLDKQRQVQANFMDTAQGLLGQAKDSMGKPLDFSSLPQMDPGFGAVKEVQDAMMSRMNPLRAEQREAELQRLHNQGLGENTEAFQRALTRMGQGDTDAMQQALLAATSAYGDIFNRTGQARQQGIGEQQLLRDQPFNDIMRLQGGAVTNPSMPNFMNAGAGATADLNTAASNQYKAAMDAFNAKQKKSSDMLGGLMGMGGSALSGGGTAAVLAMV